MKNQVKEMGRGIEFSLEVIRFFNPPQQAPQRRKRKGIELPAHAIAVIPFAVDKRGRRIISKEEKSGCIVARVLVQDVRAIPEQNIVCEMSEVEEVIRSLRLAADMPIVKFLGFVKLGGRWFPVGRWKRIDLDQLAKRI